MDKLVILTELGNIHFFQAGFTGQLHLQQKPEDESGFDFIEFDHIILPLIIIGVFHVVAFVSFMYQIGSYWCKYGEAT